MSLLANDFVFAMCMISYSVIALINAKLEFNARPNAYMESNSIKIGNLTDIGCCVKCGFNESCLATNYNRKTLECMLLKQHPNYLRANIVSRHDWVLFTKSDGCGGHWLPFQNSCYMLVETKMNWENADGYCKTLGAELVDIHSPEENAFVFNYSNSNGIAPVWIGLTDAEVENTFRWSSGRTLTYTAYKPGQPNNYRGQDCIANTMTLDRWDDVKCIFVLAFVCERPAR